MRTHMNNRKAEIEKASPSPAPKTVASTPVIIKSLQIYNSTTQFIK